MKIDKYIEVYSNIATKLNTEEEMSQNKQFKDKYIEKYERLTTEIKVKTTTCNKITQQLRLLFSEQKEHQELDSKLSQAYLEFRTLYMDIDNLFTGEKKYENVSSKIKNLEDFATYAMEFNRKYLKKEWEKVKTGK